MSREFAPDATAPTAVVSLVGRTRPGPHEEFRYTPILGAAEPETTEYRRIDTDGMEILGWGPRRILSVEPDILTTLAFESFRDISHLLRTKHLAQVAAILDDPDASSNDKFVATELLRNANIAVARRAAAMRDILDGISPL